MSDNFVEENAAKEEVETEGLDIDALVTAKHQDQLRAEAAERELAELRQQTATPVEPPDLDTYDGDEDKYIEDKIKFEVARNVAELSKKQQEDAERKRRQQADAEFKSRVVKANVPGYDTAVAKLMNAVTFAPEVIDAIQTLDKGPEVIAYLGNNLAVADEITRKGPIAAIAELGALNAKLANEVEQERSRAPEPIKPIGGGGAGIKSYTSMSMAEFMALE